MHIGLINSPITSKQQLEPVELGVSDYSYSCNSCRTKLFKNSDIVEHPTASSIGQTIPS